MFHICRGREWQSRHIGSRSIYALFLHAQPLTIKWRLLISTELSFLTYTSVNWHYECKHKSFQIYLRSGLKHKKKLKPEILKPNSLKPNLTKRDLHLFTIAVTTRITLHLVMLPSALEVGMIARLIPFSHLLSSPPYIKRLKRNVKFF